MTSVSQQKLDTPKFAFDSSAGSAGGLEISMATPEGMEIDMGDFAFSLNDVDTPPRAIRTPPVIYPFAAKQKGLKGKVYVRIRVGVDGKATNIKATRSVPPEVLEDFREAAENAVARYRFAPARIGGEAVPVWASQPILFELQ
jgi:TonB family protein